MHTVVMTSHSDTINVRTGAGVVHRLTVGAPWKHYGETFHNLANDAVGKSDCGSRTSSAATITTDPVTCPKCIAARPAPAPVRRLNDMLAIADDEDLIVSVSREDLINAFVFASERLEQLEGDGLAELRERIQMLATAVDL